MAELNKETIDKILAMFPVGSRWMSSYTWEPCRRLYGTWVVKNIEERSRGDSAFQSIGLDGEPGCVPVPGISSSIDLHPALMTPLIVTDVLFAYRLHGLGNNYGDIAVYSRISAPVTVSASSLDACRNIDNERQIVL